MTERELIELWNRSRLHIIISQLGPIFLLIVSVGLMVFGLGEAEPLVRYAALGILLASGILGALVQYQAATEAIAISRDVAALKSASFTAKRIVSLAPSLNVVRFVTPTIFVVIFVFILLELL